MILHFFSYTLPSKNFNISKINACRKYVSGYIKGRCFLIQMFQSKLKKLSSLVKKITNHGTIYLVLVTWQDIVATSCLIHINPYQLKCPLTCIRLFHHCKGCTVTLVVSHPCHIELKHLTNYGSDVIFTLFPSKAVISLISIWNICLIKQ